jgi:hypothetical protein
LSGDLNAWPMKFLTGTPGQERAGQVCLSDVGEKTLRIDRDAVHHDPGECFLEGVVQAGSPQEIYFRPDSAFAAEFLGVSNQLAGTAEGGSLFVGTQRLPYAGPVRGQATLIFKATDATLAAGTTPAADVTLAAGVVARAPAT